MAELPAKKPLTTSKQLNNYQASSKSLAAFCWRLIIWLTNNQCKPRLTVNSVKKRMKTLTNFISNFVFTARN